MRSVRCPWTGFSRFEAVEVDWARKKRSPELLSPKPNFCAHFEALKGGRDLIHPIGNGRMNSWLDNINIAWRSGRAALA
jgi:hypothetical protein